MARALLLLTAVAALYLGPTGPAHASSVEAWSEADGHTRAAALALARRAFDAYVLRRDIVEPPGHLPDLLRRRAAVFVSAMRHGAPRCCMGTLYPLQVDSASEIVENAVAAAGRDRRFPPVRPAELRGLTLIVSFVGPPRAITFADLPDIDPARDGLAVRSGERYGVVLSGETGTVERMVRWARIRAGAPASGPVGLYRLDVVRLVEGRAGQP